MIILAPGDPREALLVDGESHVVGNRYYISKRWITWGHVSSCYDIPLQDEVDGSPYCEVRLIMRHMAPRLLEPDLDYLARVIDGELLLMVAPWASLESVSSMTYPSVA